VRRPAGPASGTARRLPAATSRATAISGTNATPDTEGGFTTYLPLGEVTTIYDAARRYQAAGVPVIILAGKEHGFGSSRNWAAKGPALLGVRAVIAESYERIHRVNLIGMGILPLQFSPEESAPALGLTGREVFDIVGLGDAVARGFTNGKQLTVHVHRPGGGMQEFIVQVRIDTSQEVIYYRHGASSRTSSASSWSPGGA
jgi:aconitate hydratase